MQILIIRTSAIGDVIMAASILSGLKAAYPEAQIDWLAEPMVAPLLAGDPRVRRIILWPKRTWRDLRRKWHLRMLGRAVRRFVKDLRTTRYDLVIDLQAQLRTRLFARLARADRRIGFASREPGGFLMTRLYSDAPDASEPGMDEDYRFLFQQMGLSPDAVHPELHPSGEDEAEALRLLAVHSIAPNRFTVIAPFTTRPQKHWLADRWLELIPKLRTITNEPVILLGGPGDRQAATAFANLPGLVSFVGETRLGVSAAIISRATRLIGVDTGLTHLGTAFGIPTVALFGATRPYLSCPRAPKTKVLYHPFPCSPCRRHPTCEGRFSCMAAISVEEILNLL